MKYQVTGCDRTTGQDITRVIDARNAEEATAIASRSMLIAEVELCSTATSAVAVAQMPKVTEKKTDIFAILTFATGMLSIAFLPIVFAPICYVCAIISYYRLKENPNELKGKWLRLVGAICGAISLLWLIILFHLLPGL